MDESIVSLFFFPMATYITPYFYVSSNVKQTNQYIDLLYVCIYMYVYICVFQILFYFLTVL